MILVRRPGGIGVGNLSGSAGPAATSPAHAFVEPPCGRDISAPGRVPPSFHDGYLMVQRTFGPYTGRDHYGRIISHFSVDRGRGSRSSTQSDPGHAVAGR